MNIVTEFGAVALKAEFLTPLFAALSDKDCSIAELANLPAFRAEPHLLRQRLMLLLQNGWIGCFRGDARPIAVPDVGNKQIASLVAEGAQYRHLASARLGSGVPASDSELLMLQLYASDTAAFEKDGGELLRARLKGLGRMLAKYGKPLPPDDEAAAANRQVSQFMSRTMPLWRRLGVVS